MVESAIQTGAGMALQNALPPEEIGEGYATELLGRLPENTAMLRVRLNHEDAADRITVVGGGPQGASVCWGW